MFVSPVCETTKCNVNDCSHVIKYLKALATKEDSEQPVHQAVSQDVIQKHKKTEASDRFAKLCR